jgi:hypothetical protein
VQVHLVVPDGEDVAGGTVLQGRFVPVDGVGLVQSPAQPVT